MRQYVLLQRLSIELVFNEVTKLSSKTPFYALLFPTSHNTLRLSFCNQFNARYCIVLWSIYKVAEKKMAYDHAVCELHLRKFLIKIGFMLVECRCQR